MSTTLYIKNHLSTLLRNKCCFVFCREILNRHIGCKNMHTSCCYSERSIVILYRNRITLHINIVPECTLQAFPSIKRTLVEERFHYLQVCEVTALNILYILVFALDTTKNRNGVIRRSVIITPHHGIIVGIRSNNGNLFICIFIKRQNIIVVLQKNNTLTSHIKGNLCILLARHNRIRNLAPLHLIGIIHLTKFKATFK